MMRRPCRRRSAMLRPALALGALLLVALFSLIHPSSNIAFAQDETPPAGVTLSNLVLSRGLLTPVFAADTTAYTADVRLDDALITVTLYKTDPGSSVAYLDCGDAVIADADAETEGQQVDLELGANTIKVQVTSADGNSSETYTVTVTRNTVDTRFTGVNGQVVEMRWRDPDGNGCSENYNAHIRRADGTGIIFDIGTDVVAAAGEEGSAQITFGSGIPSPHVGWVYCGARSTGRLVGSHLGTFAGLTLIEISLSSGSLRPAFNRHHFDYEATVPSDVDQITVLRPVAAPPVLTLAFSRRQHPAARRNNDNAL